jgi:carboxypeptidase C (cathepsin A)
MRSRNWTILGILLEVLAATAYAQTHHRAATSPTTGPASLPSATQPGKSPEESKPAAEGVIEKRSATEHQITIGGAALKYRATTANMAMKDEAGKLKATVFFIAYDKDRPAGANPAERPITFVFNGGPGAAAVWLHLGAAGPRRIDIGAGDVPVGPPYRLVDNTDTWLDVTDLVFIDPVGTGFSRPAPGEKPQEFYGVKEDIQWVADFIRLYLTQFERWPSPKFLAGESYGTTRAAGLSEYLLDRFGIALNGIALISCVLDFQTLQHGDSRDLSYPLFLPTYTAIAWYHKRLPPDVQQIQLPRLLEEVQRWATDEYTVALAKGDRLSPEQRQRVVQRLARYTSLKPDFIDKANLRIDPGPFRKQVLSDQRKLVGRYDGRITGPDPDPVSNRPDYDPSLSRYLPAYSGTFNDYVRRTLKYQSDLPYEVLSEKVWPWNFGPAGSSGLSVVESLRSAVVKMPNLKVMFASGYYDLATPHYAVDYTMDHLDLPPDLRKNIAHTFYEGGHMMYHHHASLAKLKADLAGLIRSALPAEPRP